MPDLAFELGTEEMPAGAIAGATDQLGSLVTKGLADARLGVEEVRVYATPRRLIAVATGVPARQPDEEREVRGPARSVAFDAGGNPTGAAIGFARKQGVDVSALQTITVGGTEYVTAHVRSEGGPAGGVIGRILADAVKALFFPKMMRWGDQSQGGMRFVRPIRWILCLLDADIVPLELAGSRSGRRTRGHRFLAPDEVEIGHACELLPLLESRCVMVDPEGRRGVIVSQAERLAAEVNGRIPWDEALLEENIFLTEWPTALRGEFSRDYLELPRPVLVTAMKKHQRFFPVEDSSGSLLPHFISIRNGGDAHLDAVREGNETVLTARFADAHYFYAQDRATSLDAMAEQLDRLVFQEKLGTIAQKRARLLNLTGALADAICFDSTVREKALRAAALAKADLVSRMVIELPALQGVMGREYALRAGEAPEVADAIAEHYMPKTAGDPNPPSALGRLLSVADRLDTLVGYVGLGILPSGSSDPYGLRRAAHGLIQVLAEEPDYPPLVEMEALAARAYQQVDGIEFPLDRLCDELSMLFEQRMSAYLEDRGIRYDLIDAALSGGSIYSSLVYGTLKRAEALQMLSDDEGFVLLTQAAARTANILRSASAAAEAPAVPAKEAIHGGAVHSVERAVRLLEQQARVVDREALREPAESRLFEESYALLPEVARRAAAGEYVELYRELHRLRGPIDAFFDDVLVMVEDASVRANRLRLLSLVNLLFKTLADFTKVVVAGD